jgi:methionyl-tRNA formyltransferase
LREVLASRHEVVAVVTQPDRPRGRGRKLSRSPVKDLALDAELEPILQPVTTTDPEFLGAVTELGADLFAVVAYGEILKRAVLGLPPHGTVNVHASLLPKYRGTSPIQAAILNGDAETGITTIYIDEGMDTGDIVLLEGVAIVPEDTAGTLHDRLAKVGARLLVRTLDEIEAGTAKRIPQDHSRATYTSKITREDGLIDWSASSRVIHNRVRAMNPWPGAYTPWRETTVRVLQTRIPRESEMGEGNPGTVLKSDESALEVCTGDGAVQLVEIQLPGGKALRWQEFLRGHPIDVGEQLGGSG